MLVLCALPELGPSKSSHHSHACPGAASGGFSLILHTVPKLQSAIIA